MLAVKNWWMEKNYNLWLRGKELTVKHETAKAVLVECCGREMWIPKSVIVDEWEKDTTNFGYHEYLVNVYHEAYEKGLMGDKYTITSGYNKYAGDAFIHQEKTKNIIAKLEQNNVPFMNRNEWNNR